MNDNTFWLTFWTLLVVGFSLFVSLAVVEDIEQSEFETCMEDCSYATASLSLECKLACMDMFACGNKTTQEVGE